MENRASLGHRKSHQQQKVIGVRLFLFVDSLGVHKTADVRAVYDEVDITLCFNLTCSPDYNPIESVLAQVKLRFI